MCVVHTRVKIQEQDDENTGDLHSAAKMDYRGFGGCKEPQEYTLAAQGIELRACERIL